MAGIGCRFSLYCLIGHGDEYCGDCIGTYAAVAPLPETPSTNAATSETQFSEGDRLSPLVGVPRVTRSPADVTARRGRIRLSRRAVFFESDDLAQPLRTFRFSDVSEFCVVDDTSFSLSCSVVVLQMVDGLPQPWLTQPSNPPNAVHTFRVVFSGRAAGAGSSGSAGGGASFVRDVCRVFFAHAPVSSSASSASRRTGSRANDDEDPLGGQTTFSLTALASTAEQVLLQVRCRRVWPLTFERGLLVVTTHAVYFQGALAFSQASGAAALARWDRSLVFVAAPRRCEMRDVGAEFVFRTRTHVGGDDGSDSSKASDWTQLLVVVPDQKSRDQLLSLFSVAPKTETVLPSGPPATATTATPTTTATSSAAGFGTRARSDAATGSGDVPTGSASSPALATPRSSSTPTAFLRRLFFGGSSSKLPSPATPGTQDATLTTPSLPTTATPSPPTPVLAACPAPASEGLRAARRAASAAQQQWLSGEMSNYDYLILLNALAGRSFADLSQYPVLPWVIRDYTSATLDLTSPSTFRDLSRPVGALNPERLAQFIARANDLRSIGEKPYLYGSFYSNPSYVCYFLVRTHPEWMLALQSGRFDAPSRIFESVAECWASVLSGPADVKELIPEFFQGSGDFLARSRVDLGTKPDGTKVRREVELPPWASSPAHFVEMNRQALECPYVSERLHLWCDLIFGCRSVGEGAWKANNVFHPCTSRAMLSEDPNVDETALEAFAREFGHMPDLLFPGPHPARSATSPASSRSRVVDEDRDRHPGAVSALATELAPGQSFGPRGHRQEDGRGKSAASLLRKNPSGDGGSFSAQSSETSAHFARQQRLARGRSGVADAATGRYTPGDAFSIRVSSRAVTALCCVELFSCGEWELDLAGKEEEEEDSNNYKEDERRQMEAASEDSDSVAGTVNTSGHNASSAQALRMVAVGDQNGVVTFVDVDRRRKLRSLRLSDAAVLTLVFGSTSNSSAANHHGERTREDAVVLFAGCMCGRVVAVDLTTASILAEWAERNLLSSGVAALCAVPETAASAKQPKSRRIGACRVGAFTLVAGRRDGSAHTVEFTLTTDKCAPSSVSATNSGIDSSRAVAAAAHDRGLCGSFGRCTLLGSSGDGLEGRVVSATFLAPRFRPREFVITTVASARMLLTVRVGNGAPTLSADLGESGRGISQQQNTDSFGGCDDVGGDSRTCEGEAPEDAIEIEHQIATPPILLVAYVSVPTEALVVISATEVRVFGVFEEERYDEPQGSSAILPNFEESTVCQLPFVAVSATQCSLVESTFLVVSADCVAACVAIGVSHGPADSATVASIATPSFSLTPEVASEALAGHTAGQQNDGATSSLVGLPTVAGMTGSYASVGCGEGILAVRFLNDARRGAR